MRSGPSATTPGGDAVVVAHVGTGIMAGEIEVEASNSGVSERRFFNIKEGLPGIDVPIDEAEDNAGGDEIARVGSSNDRRESIVCSIGEQIGVVEGIKDFGLEAIVDVVGVMPRCMLHALVEPRGRAFADCAAGNGVNIARLKAFSTIRLGGRRRLENKVESVCGLPM